MNLVRTAAGRTAPRERRARVTRRHPGAFSELRRPSLESNIVSQAHRAAEARKMLWGGVASRGPCPSLPRCRSSRCRSDQIPPPTSLSAVDWSYRYRSPHHLNSKMPEERAAALPTEVAAGAAGAAASAVTVAWLRWGSAGMAGAAATAEASEWIVILRAGWRERWQEQAVDPEPVSGGPAHEVGLAF